MSDKKKPPLHPEVEAILHRLPEKPPDAATVTTFREAALPTLRRSEMYEINKKKRVSAGERRTVELAFERMIRDYPDKTSCYNAIAIELEIKLDRVRYIIEGPRRKKS